MGFARKSSQIRERDLDTDDEPGLSAGAHTSGDPAYEVLLRTETGRFGAQGRSCTRIPR